MEHKKTEFDGRKALIIAKDHPHFESIAVCEGADFTGAGWGMKFTNEDTNESFYVFNGRDVKWIDEITN